MEAWLQTLLDWLALPRVGLPAVFIISLVSATLLPLGSEPAVFGYVKLNPDLLWVTVGVATVGNTLGGLIDYALGYVAKRATERRERAKLARLSGHQADPAERAEPTPSSAGESADGDRQNPGAPRDDRAHRKAIAWLERFGPKAMLLAWLPVVGDPLCAVAGWLRLPFWPCAAYMLVGKLLRYAFYTPLMLWIFPN